ncbi:MAG: PqqD family protein [Candidatus Aenigmatarchaeota archaeon]|nr:PqqD family protein [Candidatus Aenigmarchaeota archaeon]
MDDFQRKPIKSSNLKIISNIGSLYATFDGSRVWEIDPGINFILTLCDGSRSIDQIAEEIAKGIEANQDDVKPTLINILAELEKNGFISYL